jgi:cobalt-zinc-cadmium efflux system outer membrane protein
LSALQDDRTTSLNALNSYAQTWMAIHQLSAASATEVVP